jgi:glucose/arabinose dehydrogenase
MKQRWRSRWAAAGAMMVVGGLAALAWSQAAVPKPAPVVVAPAPSSSAPATPRPVSAGPAPAAPLRLPAGYVVHVFAGGVAGARDLVFSPGGTLLVSQPAAATVVALPDRDGNGVADEVRLVLRGGSNPHGLAFHNGYLYVAEAQRVVRYRWDEAKLQATLDRVLFDLPANANHNKRTIIFAPDGRMFVSVGSTCNVCHEKDARSATIMVSDGEGRNSRVYATGLRNAPFMAPHPTTGDLWATEMGRDNLGDNIPPDEINIVREGQNYGWPLCYGACVQDRNFDRGANTCGTTQVPLFAIPAHSAPLGLAFIPQRTWSVDWDGDLLVAYHGSWNRSVPDGYKVVRLNIDGSAVTGAEDFMTGFTRGREVAGRPVDVAFDVHSGLFVSDDKAGLVYIVQKSP